MSTLFNMKVNNHLGKDRKYQQITLDCGMGLVSRGVHESVNVQDACTCSSIYNLG